MIVMIKIWPKLKKRIMPKFYVLISLVSLLALTNFCLVQDFHGLISSAENVPSDHHQSVDHSHSHSDDQDHSDQSQEDPFCCTTVINHIIPVSRFEISSIKLNQESFLPVLLLAGESEILTRNDLTTYVLGPPGLHNLHHISSSPLPSRSPPVYA